MRPEDMVFKVKEEIKILDLFKSFYKTDKRVEDDFAIYEGDSQGTFIKVNLVTREVTQNNMICTVGPWIRKGFLEDKYDYLTPMPTLDGRICPFCGYEQREKSIECYMCEKPFTKRKRI